MPNAGLASFSPAADRQASAPELPGSSGQLLSAWPKETSLAGVTGVRAVTGPRRCRCPEGGGGVGVGSRPDGIKAVGDRDCLSHLPRLHTFTQLAELREFS